MLEDVTNALKNLSNTRKIFHSEDDFKFALSKELAEYFEEYDIRLEYPQEIDLTYREEEQSRSHRKYFDIVLINGEVKVPIELKYKTLNKKGSAITKDNEIFKLKNQGGHPDGRASFRRDVHRVERFLKKTNNQFGYVIFLTNDKSYLNDVSKTDNLDKNYSMHHGSILSRKDDGWNLKMKKKDHWTTKGEKRLQTDLSESYTLTWERFSEIDDQEFSRILLEVGKSEQ